MGLLKTTFKFTLPHAPGAWKLVVHELLKGEHRQRFHLTRDGETVLDETHLAGADVLSAPRDVHVKSQNITLRFGAVTLSKYALVVLKDDEELWRSSDKPFRTSSKLDEKLSAWEAASEKKLTPEKQAMLERQKKLYPSMIVDFSFGILFFFVAREFGLITAALTGAGATLALFAVQPFTKHDLFGGFAIYGVIMSLISAGIAWGFQDDLAVKLRGTIMASIGIGFALFDALVRNGAYLGQRIAMYMEGLFGALNPKRASLALAGSGLILIFIDTPLAFILTTDQWIWYNAVFDNFIALPVIFGGMYLAREKRVAA